MRVFLFRSSVAFGTVGLLLAMLSCAHDQQLESIEVQPNNITFGATNIPVSADRGLAVQLRALGHYIHPPVTKDITSQVNWGSSDIQMMTVDSTGLLTATGDVCGTNTIVSATVQTNSSAGGRGSSGAVVTGQMTGSVACFTGTTGGSAVLSILFSGTGTGTVSVTPSGFLCSTNCGLSFSVGAGPITLTATPTGTSTFGGWGSNCPQANSNVCTIPTLTASTSIGVTFN